MTAQSSETRIRPWHLGVFTGVVLMHAIAIGVLSLAFERQEPPRIVTAEMVVQWVAPEAKPQPAPTTPAPQPAPKTKLQESRIPVPAAVQPTAPTPAATSEVAATVPSSTPAPSQTTPATATPTVSAPPAPPKLELPSTDADYLNNPRPVYPPLSKRLGEQGKVVVRVYIEANGSASQAEIRTSSGYDRLDQAALQSTLRWRYVPGKRNGVAEAMWFNVPINFVLE